MHEQKLVEVSVTQEGLRHAIAAARAAGELAKVKALEGDLGVLQRMEAEAERFGIAVKLDSASTFECIVEDARHFFMEVNTRIQVEHRVSELCYALRFQNPADSGDAFEVHSLVEAMALIAKHKKRLPRPTRIGREGAAIEIRLNATDRALSPAAGGVIVSWSDPIEGEIRDDQGISIKNPDTRLYTRYRLAGAYDSNVALLLATGDDREESFARIQEILRKTTLRGLDLATNLEFHLGIVTWFRARDVWAKPTTAFVVPYLTLVGELACEARTLDVEYAFQQIARRRSSAVSSLGDAVATATRNALARKETLLTRPLAMLIDEPHFLSAWLSEQHRNVEIAGGRVQWLKNPVRVLSETYHLLHLDDRPGEPAANRIWDHDKQLLETALAFYDALEAKASTSWSELDRALRESADPQWGIDAARWEAVRAAHAGHQLGLELLSLLPLVAEKTGFYDLKLNDDLSITIPDRLRDPAHQDAMRKVLVPPPATKADEIVAAMGGTYYAQEAPDLPPFVTVGMHFEKGTPLYLIEVMKMFNKVYASFSGTIDAILVDSSVVVRKGQPLFKVTPDEWMVEEDPADRARMIRANTDNYLARVVG
jgi:biotin carboxyl carrier protein